MPGIIIIKSVALLALLCSCAPLVSQAFTVPSSVTPSSRHVLFSAVQQDVNVKAPGGGDDLLSRDRYVAMNRFSVREGQQAKFEKRWATRKSRLATLDGFKYFHLMRRVSLNEDGTNTYDEGERSDDSAFGNYVSFTIWDRKSNFQAWRQGEAFKEAHGGTSIGAFVSAMVSSLMVLRGPPKPAFYDGLLVQSTMPTVLPEVVDGWRRVEADGVETLGAECFVSCNQFFVPPEQAAGFEQRWASRESKLAECDGFVAFGMLRRDLGGANLNNGEPNYLSTTIWRDRQAFDGWRNGEAFRKAHGSGSPPQGGGEKEQATQPPKPQWSKPPQPVFYEGILVINTEDGA